MLQPAVVAAWCSDAELMSMLTLDVWVWPLFELPVLRSLDGHRATVARRLDAQSAPVSGIVADGKDAVTEEPMQVTGAADEDNDQMDDDSRAARTNNAVSADDENAGDEQPRPAEDFNDKVDAEEAVSLALEQCNKVYATLVAGLLSGLSARYQELKASTADEVELDPWAVAALSLLKHVIRSFSGSSVSLDLTAPFRLPIAPDVLAVPIIATIAQLAGVR